MQLNVPYKIRLTLRARWDLNNDRRSWLSQRFMQICRDSILNVNGAESVQTCEQFFKQCKEHAKDGANEDNIVQSAIIIVQNTKVTLSIKKGLSKSGDDALSFEC